MNELNLYMLILSTYLISSIAYASSQWPTIQNKNKLYLIGLISGSIGIAIHSHFLFNEIYQQNGLSLTIANIISLIGLQLAITAVIAAFNKTMRGFAGGILLISSLSALLSIWALDQFNTSPHEIKELSWQVNTHAITSLLAYGLLCTGAIIALFALVQDKRLKQKRISSLNALFAPLETTERTLFNIASFGSTLLFLSVFSGIIFIENIFSQHLAHKTILSITALIMFSILVYGRRFFGWRGKSTIYLYLSAFLMLATSYFGTKFILENILGRSWG